MKRTTISDIARAAGVSETSVSLVLTGRPNRISSAMKEKIKETAKALSYVPNSFARGLATKKSNTIGLIVPDIENGYFASLSKAISFEAEKAGYIVLLLNSNDSHDLSIKQINTLIERNVDGLILVVSNESYHQKNMKELKAILSSLSIPYVLSDRDFPDFKANKVYYDNIEGGYLATKLLLQSKHKKIACITGPSDTFSSIQRLVGYKKALEEFHIPFNDSLVEEGDYRLQSGFASAVKLLKKDFDSLFCFNDMMAFGAILALKNHDISVPDDVSVVGYDDNIMSSLSGSELATINQDPSRLAKETVSLLLDALSNPSQTEEEIKLKPSLVERNSVKKI